MKKVLLAAAVGLIGLVLFITNVRAGNADAGTISTVHFINNGIIIFYTSGARTNVPQCATTISRFAFNGTTAAGKLLAAGLLSAYAMGKQVVVIGTGTCGDWSDSESVGFFYTVG